MILDRSLISLYSKLLQIVARYSMAGRPFPVANATEPFWRQELHELDDHRTTETLPGTADTVIIGAGYAGASIAYHILKKFDGKPLEQKPSILILEARGACSGATGRNGGHCKPDPFTRATKVLDTHGKEAADEVASFEARHLTEIGKLVKKENIDCDFVLTRTTDVCLYVQGRKAMDARLARLAHAGVAGIDDVFHCGEDRAEGLSGIKGALSATTYTAGHLWPYRMVLHLLRKCIEQGADLNSKTRRVNLQTHTPVKFVSTEQDANGLWTVSTPRGDVKAKKVIYASNGYTGGILPELKNKIVPVRGICCRIVSPKPRAPLLSNSYALRFNEWEYDYLIPRTDGSIVVGGARRDYHMDLDSWFGNHDDSELIEPAKDYFDGYMQRHFHGWEDSEAYTESIWTGIMGYSADGFPFVGEVPGKPNQYICAGFSGHGMPQAFLSARAIADMIVDDKKIDEVDLPRVYRSSRERFESEEQHVSLKTWDAIPAEYKHAKSNGSV